MSAPAQDIRASGPVLLFGGCYGNLQATLALLDEARRLGIPADHIICTGDIVAYCADPEATVEAIRSAGVHVVRGNCEESLGAGAGDCGCGFAPGSACDRLSASWYAHAEAAIGTYAKRWMSELPDRLDLVMGGIRLAIVHGSPARSNEFVFASAPDDALRAHIEATGCDGIVGGHCGLPFTRLVDGLLWHNPGVIGMPANDGTPRTWFSVLAARGDAVEIRHLPLDYDHRAAALAMAGAGLPDGYAATLSSGVWPSLDVLPPTERALTGAALPARTLLWPKPLVQAGP